MRKLLLLALGPALLLGAANSQSAPSVKEGYWSFQMKDSVNDAKPATNKICRSHAYDKSVEALANATMACKTISDSTSGSTHTVESECKVQNTVVRTKTVTVMSGDTAFHSESHATYTPAFYGQTEAMTIIDEKYLGPCPAGIVPGDMVYADGHKRNSWKH